MKIVLTLIVLFSSTLLHAQNPGKEEFNALLERAQIDFTMPDSCTEIKVDYLHKIPHNFAIIPADSSFQIRYFVQPLDTYLESYNKKSKKKQKESMHPDQLCKSMMILAVLNASNNRSQEYQVSLYPEMTKEVFNCDWDAVAFVECGWPQVGYKYCYIWSLHKDGLGEIYMYGLANKKEDLVKITPLMTQSVKFR